MAVGTLSTPEAINREIKRYVLGHEALEDSTLNAG
jgi:hypothetical protein